MATPEEEFSRYHEKLRSELNIVNWHFTVLKYIKEIQNDYLKELNQAPAFWGLTINAHLNPLATISAGENALNTFLAKAKPRGKRDKAECHRVYLSCQNAAEQLAILFS